MRGSMEHAHCDLHHTYGYGLLLRAFVFPPPRLILTRAREYPSARTTTTRTVPDTQCVPYHTNTLPAHAHFTPTIV